MRMSKQNRVTIKDLLARKNLRSRVYTIEGLGEVELHEITANESEALQSGYIEGDTKAESRRIAGWALRFMSADMRHPTDEEIDALLENCSSDVIVEIFRKGMTFSSVGGAAKADAEKN
jgi:hypothetical protein